MLRSVKVPRGIEPLFARAQELVDAYFSTLRLDPARGTAEIGQERYILVRAASLSVEFFETVRDLYGDLGEDAEELARGILFDVAHAIGRRDASYFHGKLRLSDPVDKLSAGPVHFAYSGWAFVDIFPESRLSPDEDYFLIYDHPFSFESSSWLRLGKASRHPVCVMNAGYSSGWCTVSFGLPLVSHEVLCRARGDSACRFIMAPPARMAGHVRRFAESMKGVPTAPYRPPGFFAHKRIADRLLAEKEKARLAAQALERSESEFRRLVEQLPGDQFFYRADLDGVLTYVSPNMRTEAGYRPDQALGRNYREFLTSSPVNAGVEQHFQGLLRGEPQGPYELEMRGGDGSIHQLEVVESPVFGDDGRVVGVEGMARDITERKRAQEAVERLQRLESLGLLAGGIAHDFNNIVTGIMGSLALLRDNAALSQEDRTLLGGAENACMAAGGLARQLLTFAKGGEPMLESQEVSCIVQQAAEFALRGSNVRLDFDPGAGPAYAQVDKGQIFQVFQNIAINAVQAMPDGGGLKVSVSTLRLAEDEVPTLPAGDYVRVALRDEGPGIPPDALSKVFDPYFSLKGKSRGLGLSVAHSIVRRHGGHIGVESLPGSGATFTIHVPAASRPVLAGQPPADGSPAAHGERILVMDDQPAVVEVLVGMLGKLGYRAAGVPDGAQAVHAWGKAQRSGEPFAAAILDLTVPGGMGGAEAARLIRQLDREARMVVSSGYSNDPVMSRHEKYGFCGVLPKPYRLQDLKAALGRALASKPVPDAVPAAR